jgi:DNA-directed RNA polymerase specialized sigma24 family protein
MGEIPDSIDVLEVVDQQMARGLEGDALVRSVLQSIPERPTWGCQLDFSTRTTSLRSRTRMAEASTCPIIISNLIAEKDRWGTPWWYTYFDGNGEASNTPFFRRTTKHYDKTLRNVTTPGQLQAISNQDLIDATTPLVRKACARILKQNAHLRLSQGDLMQEAWVTVLGLRERFQDRGTHFAAFVAVALSNRLADYVRHIRTRYRRETPLLEVHEEVAASEVDYVGRVDLLSSLRTTAGAGLWLEWWLSERTVKAFASDAGLEYSVLRQRLSRARRELAASLGWEGLAVALPGPGPRERPTALGEAESPMGARSRMHGHNTGLAA